MDNAISPLNVIHSKFVTHVLLTATYKRSTIESVNSKHISKKQNKINCTDQLAGQCWMFELIDNIFDHKKTLIFIFICWRCLPHHSSSEEKKKGNKKKALQTASKVRVMDRL